MQLRFRDFENFEEVSDEMDNVREELDNLRKKYNSIQLTLKGEKAITPKQRLR